MRYMVTSNTTNSFFSGSHEEFEDAEDINGVIEIIKRDWINTPDYVSYLKDNFIEGETICIIDYDEVKSGFMETSIETRVDIKIYD